MQVSEGGFVLIVSGFQLWLYHIEPEILVIKANIFDRECLAEIIMKVLEKPLSVEETHAILDKARGFGGESKAPAGKKPRRGKQA